MNYPQFLIHHAAIRNSQMMWKTLKNLDEENKTTSVYAPLEIKPYKTSKKVEERIKRKKKREETANALREQKEVNTVIAILGIVAIIIMTVALGGIKIIM